MTCKNNNKDTTLHCPIARNHKIPNNSETKTSINDWLAAIYITYKSLFAI